MKLLLTGATGALGRSVLTAARPPGLVLRALSRRPGPGARAAGVEWARADLVTGDGVRAALEAVDVVVHAATDPRRSAEVDDAGTRRLVAEARRARVAHIVYVSIVGIDRIPLDYYRYKLAAERSIAASGVPYTIVRITQFHSLLAMMMEKAARLPLLLPLPTRFRFQSVAPEEAARRLLRCVEEGPRGRVRDFAGPEVLSVGEAARIWLEVRGERRLIVPVAIPGRVGAGFRRGWATAPGGELGTIGWRAWLAARVNGRLEPAAP